MGTFLPYHLHLSCSSYWPVYVRFRWMWKQRLQLRWLLLLLRLLLLRCKSQTSIRSTWSLWLTFLTVMALRSEPRYLALLYFQRHNSCRWPHVLGRKVWKIGRACHFDKLMRLMWWLWGAVFSSLIYSQTIKHSFGTSLWFSWYLSLHSLRMHNPER